MLASFASLGGGLDMGRGVFVGSLVDISHTVSSFFEEILHMEGRADSGGFLTGRTIRDVVRMVLTCESPRPSCQHAGGNDGHSAAGKQPRRRGPLITSNSVLRATIDGFAWPKPTDDGLCRQIGATWLPPHIPETGRARTRGLISKPGQHPALTAIE